MLNVLGIISSASSKKRGDAAEVVRSRRPGIRPSAAGGPRLFPWNELHGYVARMLGIVVEGIGAAQMPKVMLPIE